MKRGKKENVILNLTNIEQHIKFSKSHISGMNKYEVDNYQFQELEEVVEEMEKLAKHISKKTIQ